MLTTIPLLVKTGLSHFHSSVIFGSASWINLRRRAISLPRQSFVSAMRLSISLLASILNSLGEFPPILPLALTLINADEHRFFLLLHASVCVIDFRFASQNQ